MFFARCLFQESSYTRCYSAICICKRGNTIKVKLFEYSLEFLDLKIMIKSGRLETEKFVKTNKLAIISGIRF